MGAATEQISQLTQTMQVVEIPDELKNRVFGRLKQLEVLLDSPTFLPELDRMTRYIEWISAIPWNKRTEDLLELTKAKEILDTNHFGLEEIKARILEYLAVMKLKREKGEYKDFMRAPILCFVGLVGTGKTTIAKSIAEAMGRQFVRIPFGGMGDPLDLRGKSRMHAEAEPGKIIKALVTAQSRNPVVLLDEIDRVTEEGRSSIMGVLVELLDPEQNAAFVDHYIDYPVDLSEVLFVATSNNTTNIATAVLDRMEPVSMPSYTDQEKITIGKQYMLPEILKQAGIGEESVVIDDEVWASIVRPLGFDAGMRTLQRTIQGMIRKAARDLVEGKTQQFHITQENVKQFLPL